MPVVPKKRITQYFARRRRLNFYMDHYRFLYKFRREHFDRRKYQEPLYVKDYSTPEFRFPGFWPGKFGYPHSQDQREQPLLESSGCLSSESQVEFRNSGRRSLLIFCLKPSSTIREVNEILYVSFNQDYTCFVCGTESGFRVYSTDPFHLTFRRDFEDGSGLGVVCMLFRTNILAFSGGGKNPRFQPHKVVLWDDRHTRVMAELSFKTPVKSVKLRRDLVVVATINKVWAYGFKTLSLLDSIETSSNPKGLCCLSAGERVVLCCPGMQQGSVLVAFYSNGFGDPAAPGERERTMIITAHDASL
ncbi:unnamed protein product [Effrenium voratum]|uniref:Uncharacterized protein n=1 Tax=Effrenium voratum TaxID=2562239 RepID=A0AA36N233_9DINO|nr:unnamed protein product [Effrenium voratum]